MTRKTTPLSPAYCDDSPCNTVDQHIAHDRDAKNQQLTPRCGARNSNQEHGRWPDEVPHSPKVRHAHRIDTQKDILSAQQHKRHEAPEQEARNDGSLHGRRPPCASQSSSPDMSPSNDLALSGARSATAPVMEWTPPAT